LRLAGVFRRQTAEHARAAVCFELDSVPPIPALDASILALQAGADQNIAFIEAHSG